MATIPGSPSIVSREDSRAAARTVGLWLLSVAAVVFVMVVVGGITRLTESGLSMVDWRPVTGWLPPLSDQAWAAEFAKYQQFPEYRLVNRGMSLEEFKTIFYWEWGHRVLGRLIGLIYAVPLLVFWLRGMIPPGYKPRLLGLLVLGGCQGLLGWFMVKSGLVDRPEVSHLRLTAHLSLALVIFACLAWVGLDLTRGRQPVDTAVSARLRLLTWAFAGLLALQVIMGGLVAGLKAGYAYNSWPLMDGAFIPDGLFYFTPWWQNLIDNTLTVQFNHRMGAYAVLAFGVMLVWQLRRKAADPSIRQAAVYLLVALVGQVLLGIATLVAVVPVSLGALHQAGGVIVIGATVNLLQILARPSATLSRD